MMTNVRKEDVDNLREAMGTMPNNDLVPHTVFYAGVHGITVEMTECPENPYRAIFEASVATWGNEEYATKWDNVSPENRFKVVKAALSGQTLPQALEPVNFMFIVRGASRAQFDQHARQRVGATFFSQGVRDNSRADAGFRVPTEFLSDLDLMDRIGEYVKDGKDLYAEIIRRGMGSYQSARAILPMGITHNYKYAANLQAIKGYMAQRLQACEQEDTVFVAISIRKAIEDKFPLIASHLKPGCDYAKKCTYHQSYTLSEMFGCLFAGCGRWPDENKYSTFNGSCSNYRTMAEQGGIELRSPTFWREYDKYEHLYLEDRVLFEA